MKNSLTTRMILWVTMSVTAIFTAISSYDYWFTSNLLNLQLRQLAELEVSASETKASDMLDRLQHQADLTAALVTQISPSQNKLESMIATAMQQNEAAYGMAIVVDPNTTPKTDHTSYASYFFRNEENLNFVNLANESYNFRQKDWYLQAQQLESPQWTEPYFDEGAGDVLMSTYLVPVKRVDGFTLITIDLALSTLQKMLANMEDKQDMSIYAMTPGGHIISGNDESLMLQQLYEIGMRAKNTPPWFHTLIEEIKNRKSGSFSTYCQKMQEDCWISYAPLGDTQWTMLVSYSHTSLTAQLNTYSIHRALQMALGIMLLILVIWAITRRQFLPLKELDKATQAFAKGKLDYTLPAAPRNDEIGSLTQSFSHMQVSLQEHIKELQQETKQRERINSELRTANEIQQSLLPSDNEINNKALGIQLSAYLQPARAVGGDLYYYHIQNEQQLHGPQLLRFVIGDVSDKGVAAAIFMARVVTAIRAIGEQVADPADLLTQLNHQLVEDNDACMFVTLLAGTLDLHSGELKIASAGHPMPFYLHEKSNKMPLVKQITQFNGPALGLYGYQFESLKMTIEPNSYLFTYTDGLDEATNMHSELYGEDNIIKNLKANFPSSASELISNTLSAINQFTGDAEPADDLTLLAIHWEGVKKVHTREITIKSRQEELEQVNTALNEFLVEHHLPESLLLELQLIAEEIMVNTINYGYAGRVDETISVLISHNKSHITMTFVDQAKAFNPLELGEARLGMPEAEGAVGGLGVHLVKEMCDACSYEYVAGENRFTVKILLEKGK